MFVCAAKDCHGSVCTAYVALKCCSDDSDGASLSLGDVGGTAHAGFESQAEFEKLNQPIACAKWYMPSDPT